LGRGSQGGAGRRGFGLVEIRRWDNRGGVTAEDELKDVGARWTDALRRKDYRALERFLAPEYALVSRMGIMPREMWLAVAREYNVEDFRFEESEVHVYGDVGVVRSRYWQRAELRGQSLTGTYLLTDVWVRSADGWKIVSRHSTYTEAEA
jgi:ketosteroid isomerase-like protein